MGIYDKFPENYSVNQAQTDAGQIGSRIDIFLDKLVESKEKTKAALSFKALLEMELGELEKAAIAGECDKKTYQFYRAFTNIMYESVGINAQE